MSILILILTAIHIVVAVFVILLVLMQKSSEQGVGAAFGGGMTETVFGAGTTTALVRMTIWCACLLLATTLILAVLHSHRTRTGGSLMRRSLGTMPVAPMGPSTGQPTFPGGSQPFGATGPSTAPSTPSTATASPSAPTQSSPAAPASPAPATSQPSSAPKSP
jgi:preprotein translocase subunit SecG